MAGTTKLMTAGGGGVSLTPASSITSDVTVKVPVTGVNNGTLVCSDSSGNVGIGTSSPAARVSITEGSSNLNIGRTGSTVSSIIEQTTGDFRIRNSASNTDQYVDSARNVIFGTGASYTERMRIDSSGNLLVGTTGTLSGQLSVYNGIGVRASDNYSSIPNIRFFTGVDTNGGIYCDFQNTAQSRIGSISRNGTGIAYNTSSDYRLKENIQPMQNALGVVAQLNPVTYTWKENGSDGQGFIAHELQAVVPDCVTGEKDAVDAEGNPVYQGIDTSFLVATLTKAIQELNEKVEAQAAEIAALKGAA